MSLFTELFGQMSSKAPSGAAETPAKPRQMRRVRVRGQRSGGWQAAQFSPFDKDFTRFPVPISQELSRDLPSLRARSRHLAKSDSFITRFLALGKANVIGPNGFLLSSSAKTAKGGLSKGIQDAIESAWQDACRKGVLCAQNRMSMREMGNTAFLHWVRDGEAFVVDYIGAGENKYGISFRFVDAELVPLTYNRKLPNGNVIKMGIEIDTRGRMIAVHFRSLDATAQNWYYHHAGKGYIRVPAERVIHAYCCEYDGQLRGVPATAAALMKARRISAYEDTEVIGARVGASIMAPIETSAEGRAFDGEGTVESGGLDEEIDVDAEVEEYEEHEIELEPGSFPRLEPGAKLSMFNPNRPPSAYEPFMKTCLRGLASSLNASYNLLANDGEGVNFSTMRTFALEEREAWKQSQRFLIENVFDVMFERWLNHALLNGAIVLQNGTRLNWSEYARLVPHSFQGRRWPWVDPFKDVQTTRIELQERLTSRRRVIKERGDDPDEIWKEISDETKKLQQLGIAPVNPKDAAGLVAPEEEDDEKPKPEDEDDETADK